MNKNGLLFLALGLVAVAATWFLPFHLVNYHNKIALFAVFLPLMASAYHFYMKNHLDTAEMPISGKVIACIVILGTLFGVMGIAYYNNEAKRNAIDAKGFTKTMALITDGSMTTTKGKGSSSSDAEIELSYKIGEQSLKTNANISGSAFNSINNQGIPMIEIVYNNEDNLYVIPLISDTDKARFANLPSSKLAE